MYINFLFIILMLHNYVTEASFDLSKIEKGLHDIKKIK
jgi:hypothetical protein